MSKHTPGPWGLVRHEDTWLVGPGIVIDDTAEEDEANARLIAAAPELLAALERTLSNAVGHASDAREGWRGFDRKHCEEWPWVQDARAIISKARKEEA